MHAHVHYDPLWWIGFNLAILGLLALDLGVFHRRNATMGVRESLAWTVIWIAVAMAFNYGIIYPSFGGEKSMEFLTGYVIEKALSVDNLFVFLVLFQFFRVPDAYQHRILFWGILGALIMRAGFIFGGIALIEHFHFLIYVFGFFLIWTGYKVGSGGNEEPDPMSNPMVRLVKRFLPVTRDFVGGKFLVRRNKMVVATPLLLVLVAVETTDLIFAVDSIPAIIAITNDEFIVYTSNVFAILGLRSLYFALAAIMKLFRYLKYGLAFILVFVGVKMVLSDIFKIPIPYALGMVIAALGISIGVSLIRPDETAEVHSADEAAAKPVE